MKQRKSKAVNTYLGSMPIAKNKEFFKEAETLADNFFTSYSQEG